MLFAFQVTDFYSGEAKEDPDLVEWEANIITSTGLPEYEVSEPVGVHICTDEDWDTFYKSTNKTEPLMSKM